MDGVVFRRAPSNRRSKASRVAFIPVGIVAAVAAATKFERVVSFIEVTSSPVQFRRPAVDLRRVSGPCAVHRLPRGELICRKAERSRSKAGRTPTAPRGFGSAAVSTIDDPAIGFDEGPKTFDVKVYPNPLLRKRNKVVTEFGPKLRQLADNLFATMYGQSQGGGLAAPQVGVNVRMIVFNPLRVADGAFNREGEYVYVNPQILSVSESQNVFPEECMSAPDIQAPIKRPEWVELKAHDLDGRSITRRLEGAAARFFLHEYDHLQGVLFTDRVPTEELHQYREALGDLRALYSRAGGRKAAINPRPGALVYTNSG